MDLSSILGQSTVLSFLFFLLLGVLFLFIFRDVFCWFWKINDMVALLEDIKKNTSANNRASEAKPIK